MPSCDMLLWARRAGVAMMVLSAACAPASLVEVSPPSNVVDPSTAASAAGAAQLYTFVVAKYSQILGGNGTGSCSSVLAVTGMITDELMSKSGQVEDLRNFSAGNCRINSYQGFHVPRVEARQARDALQLYAPNTPKAWLGRLSAIEANTVLWLAEVFCSGIPLTTVTLSGQPTYTVGFTTEQLFTYAAALFDTAIVQGADTARFVYLAKVGKGRALLGLGKFSDAAAAVHDVPTDFVNNTEHESVRTGMQNVNVIGDSPRGSWFTQDREGTNGLVWSTDPRAAIVMTPTLSSGMPYTAKYSKTSAGVLDPTVTTSGNPVRSADGIEARLIEAEADLAAGGTNWLILLNVLRSTCIGTAVCAPIPGLTAAALPPLADPGTVNARLDLLMRERAMWLFLTGHRQGDMRRLAHVYHRDANTIWPTGLYNNPGFPPLVAAASTNGQAYGTGVVLDVDASNELGNSSYTGCFNLDP